MGNRLKLIFFQITRTGRKVQFKEAAMPEELKKRYILDGLTQAEFDVDRQFFFSIFKDNIL